MKRIAPKRLLFVYALALSFIASSLGPVSAEVFAPRGSSGAARRQAVGRVTQAARAQAAKPAPPTPLAEPAPIVNKVLANGLEVVVLEDHSVPLVTVELAVRNGSFTEPPELNGLSHLYEHMFFKANRAIWDREEYIRNIDALGIIYNGETKEELVNYYFTTTTPNFPIAMRFMRDATLYPGFDQRWFAQLRTSDPERFKAIQEGVERQFEQEREVVIGELDRHESNPYGEFLSEMNDRLFFKYPSRKDPGGNRQTVGAATTEMMRLIQSRYYVPNNSAIIVTGDVNPQAVFAMVEEMFGAWPRSEDPFKKFPLVEHPPLEKSEGVVVTKPVGNVLINIGWHGPSVGKDDAATYAADVFSFIIRQPNSRFQRALVDSGIVAGANLGYYTQRNVGPIQASASTTPEKAREAVRALYNEIAHFDDPDYYTDEELESAKALLEADDLYSREKLSEYAHTISFWWSSTGLDYYRGYLKRLRATSRADISRYVKTYIQGKPHVGMALMSEEAARQSGLTAADLIGPEGRSAKAAAGR